MYVMRVLMVGLLFQVSLSKGMEIPLRESLHSVPHLSLASKMIVCPLIFTSLYALSDLSAGVCTRASLKQAFKDGLITSAVVGGSWFVCKDFPTDMPGSIWVVAVGLAPAVLMVHNFLFKRALGLQPD